jgi:transposase
MALTDEQWNAIRPFAWERSAILVSREGMLESFWKRFCRLLDLPADFGHWNSVFKQCRRWVKCAALAGAFSAL